MKYISFMPLGTLFIKYYIKVTDFFFIKCVYHFCILLIVKILFYLNSDYVKSPYIKDPQRKFVEVPYNWEKTFYFRRNQIAYKTMDVEDFVFEHGEAKYKQNLFRWKRDEVMDYPFVWQPDIIDEWDDFRYRYSAYLKKPVLRIYMHYRWSEENFTDIEKTIIVSKVILIPLGFIIAPIWIYTNFWLFYDFYFEKIFLNDFILNNIGLEVPTLYSVLIRLYYTNTINQIVANLVERTDEVANYIWVMDRERAFKEKYEKGEFRWHAHGFYCNFWLTGGRYSLEKSLIRKGVHNYNLVNNLLIDFFFAYDTHNKLDNFLMKEILIALKIEQEKAQIVFDDEMRKKTSWITRFFDFVLKPYRLYLSYFTDLSTGFVFGLAYDYCRYNKGNYFITNDLAKWAFFDANVHFQDTVWRHYNWWRYCNAFPKASIPGYDAINTIEYIRNMSIKRYYFKDFFKFCIIEIYDRLLKPKSDSYFWTFLDAINIKNKSHWMHGTIYVYICSPIIQAWFNFVNSCREFRDNLKYSPIGFLFFLDFHKPGKYEQTPEYTHPLRNRYPIDSVYIPGNSSLFNTLKYKLVFQHGWWDFTRGYINIQSGHNVRDNLILKQAFPTSMGTNNYKMQWWLNRPGNNFYSWWPISIDHYTKFRPWCPLLLSWSVAPLFCAVPIVDYIHDYNNPLPGIIDTSKNLGFEEMFPIDAKFLFNNRMLLRSDQFYDPQWGGVDNKSTLDIFWVNYDLSLNIFANLIFLNLIFNFLSIIFLFKIFLYSVKPLKIFNDFIIRNIYLFFWDLFKNLVLNIRLERFFFIIISYFFCIVFFNLGGFSFYELSFMSHVSVTFFFSFSIFINYIINIFINFNELIYLKFVQKANIFLVPFLFIIEIISFLVRPFSLGIRLFANVMSGHILMHMFFSTFVFCYKISFWVSLIIFSFCMFIFFMELFVSFIQAYIFMILLLVYSADLVNIH